MADPIVGRSIDVYDNAFMTVTSGSRTLSPGSAIINNADTPNGTIFEVEGGSPATVTLDDTSADPDTFNDRDGANHTITDGGGLVDNGTPVEADSRVFVRALDEFGNQTGPATTITVFSQDDTNQKVWGFHSDTPLVAGTQWDIDAAMERCEQEFSGRAMAPRQNRRNAAA